MKPLRIRLRHITNKYCCENIQELYSQRATVSPNTQRRWGMLYYCAWHLRLRHTNKIFHQHQQSSTLYQQSLTGVSYENRTRDSGITTRGFATKLTTPLYHKRAFCGAWIRDSPALPGNFYPYSRLQGYSMYSSVATQNDLLWYHIEALSKAGLEGNQVAETVAYASTWVSSSALTYAKNAFIWHRFFPVRVNFRHRKDKFRTLLPYRNTLYLCRNYADI